MSDPQERPREIVPAPEDPNLHEPVPEPVSEESDDA